MRIEQIKEKGYQRIKRQNTLHFNNKAANPTFKEINYDIYFKSVDNSANINKALIIPKKDVTFTGYWDIINKATKEGALKIASNIKSKSLTSNEKPKNLIQIASKSLEETLLPYITKFDNRIFLGLHKDISSLKKLYKNSEPKLAKKIEALEAVSGNKEKIEYLYTNFISNNFYTFASRDTTKGYTGFWAKTKKLGKRNLVDLGLSSLNIDIKGKTPTEKAKIFNELPREEKMKFVAATVKHWVKEVMPVELDNLNRNNVKHLQHNVINQNFMKTDAAGIKKDLTDILDNNGIEELESVNIGNKNLVDFWIDTIEGDKASIDFSPARKKRKLMEIIDSQEDFNKIYQATIEETNKTTEQIKNTQEAYENILKEPELDETGKEILKEYQNHQLFLSVVHGGAKNKKITNLEISAIKVIDELAGEKKTIAQQAKKNLFEPLKDVNYMSGTQNAEVHQSRMDAMVSILMDKVDYSSPEEIAKIKQHVEFLAENTQACDVDLEPLLDDMRKCVYENRLLGDYGSSRAQALEEWERSSYQNYKEDNFNYKISWEMAHGAYVRYLKSSMPDDLLMMLCKVEEAIKTNDSSAFPLWENLKSKINQLFEKNGKKWPDIKNPKKPVDETMVLIETKMKEQNKDIMSPWLDLVNTAEEHFTKVQTNNALDEAIRKINTTQEVLATKPSEPIQKVLEDKKLHFTQKNFIARYADDENIFKMLSQPAINKNEAINSLVSTENANKSLFEAISFNFRNNLTQEKVNQLPEYADSYLKVLGHDSTKLNNKQKYELLVQTPIEELDLASVSVQKNWSENFLSKVVSEKALEEVKKLDPGYNTGVMVKQLDKISIQMDGQQRTLSEIANNIDHFIDVYQKTSAAIYSKLSEMSSTLDGIHADTSNIKGNMRAMVFQSIQSTKNPVLKEQLQGLLSDADSMGFSDFMKNLDAKQQRYNDDHPFNAFCNILKESGIGQFMLPLGALAVDTFAPGVGSFCLVHGMTRIGGLIKNNLGPAVNTAIQCSNPKVGFAASLLTKNKFGAEISAKDMLSS